MMIRQLATAVLPVLLAAAPASATLDPPLADTPLTEKMTRETDNYTFEYRYPKSLSRDSRLYDYLNQDRKKEYTKFSTDADRDHADAAAIGENGPRLLPYDYQVHWSQEADIPAFISLTQHWYGFYGGAHGIYGTKSWIWNKSQKKMVEPLMLFRSAEAFNQALQTEFCKQLNEQRAEKRGQPVVTDSDDSFDKCITPSGHAIILGSTTGNSFDSIKINVGPYAAGPYVEGDYEIDLSVTKAIMGAVKPAYRENFAIKR
ncbi:PdaC/SigV domain-containing protein [Parasphingorhabdus cellanae]|uniref:DUF4163 domain-containing protein n=1 Tax=Parasphingorhabdus cellanae TaxID=2806553 RepID=A0ABX7TAB8_9SPHN|nr:DUF4163 domain-containing protein [Parasphingorhabdus cellanae]QTD57148.1 DUF4163 domain-containing protein [Parasphingorhabdus cellanae]